MNKKSKINKVMLSISTMALSLALQTHVVAEEKVPYNVLKTKPVGIEKSVDEIKTFLKRRKHYRFKNV